MKNKQNIYESKDEKSSLIEIVSYAKDLLLSGPEGAVGKGLELGVGAALAKTLLRRLPAPLNFVVPFVAEKIIMKHGFENGREVLLKGLRWVKKATDEKPVVLG